MNNPSTANRPGKDLKDAVVLVTGSSRGIGAETVKILANKGAHPIVNYREKAKRAQKLVDEITGLGGKASLIGGDITDEQSRTTLVETVKELFGKLDVLVLNASGGLEMGKDENYPMLVNRDAQLSLVQELLPYINDNGRIIFVTSHQAHFHGKKPIPADYEPIAKSKKAGELAIREHLKDNTNVSLTVVSGDMIDGTIIVTLLSRRDPEAVQNRREQGGKLPTVEEFASEIVQAITLDSPQGHTIYVGGEDYLAD